MQMQCLQLTHFRHNKWLTLWNIKLIPELPIQVLVIVGLTVSLCSAMSPALSCRAMGTLMVFVLALE
jgi:hypothetical protein